MTTRRLCARWMRYLVAAALALLAHPKPAYAGIPVIDWSNVIQSTVSAFEDVNQSAQLVLNYKNQLDQYERMLTDAIVPAVYLWDNITQTVDTLRTAQKSLRNGRAALRTELKKFVDPNYYRGSSCYNSGGAKGGCFEGYRQLMQALQEREDHVLEERDNMLDKQIDSLTERAAKAKKLSANAQGATGQLEAVQYTNQLLDAQYAELRDTRALLLTQQQVAAEEQRKQLAREAAARALSEKWHGGEFKRSTPGAW
jgi:type IV secretion system protein TrbJ